MTPEITILQGDANGGNLTLSPSELSIISSHGHLRRDEQYLLGGILEEQQAKLKEQAKRIAVLEGRLQNAQQLIAVYERAFLVDGRGARWKK